MPTIDIPDKICSHCGGTKWYQHKNKYWCHVKLIEKYKESYKNRDKEKFNNARRLTNSYKNKLLKEKQERQEYKKLNPIIKKIPLTRAQISAKHYLKVKNDIEYKKENRKRAGEYYKKYPEKVYAHSKISKLKYPKKYNETGKIKKKEYRDSLSNIYIKDLICQDSVLKSNDIPDDIIELKRNQILLKRKIKNNDNKEEHSN